MMIYDDDMICFMMIINDGINDVYEWRNMTNDVLTL